MKVISTLIILILVSSCLYEAPEEMTDVDPISTPPNITIQRLDLDEDTIVIWRTTRYSYDFISDNQPIWGIELNYFGKKHTIEGSRGSFEIDPSEKPNGIYKLKLLLYTQSGTGSLADNLGTEAYVFTKEWTLVIRNPRLPEALITGAAFEKGHLTVHWQKYDEPIFHSYELFVSGSTNYSRLFYDKETTSFTDSTYTRGDVDFTMRLYYYYSPGVIYNVTSPTYEYKSNQP